MRIPFIMAMSSLALIACGGEKSAMEKPDAAPDPAQPATTTPAQPATTLPAITAETLSKHLSVLASDDFQGRAPATEGGRKTRAYLIDQMTSLGLEPGNGDSFEQPVGLVELTVNPSDSFLTVTNAAGEAKTLSYRDEAVYWSKKVQKDISFADSEMVFVGFGVVAPEYNWNDYDGIDVTGKTVVMLINDPGFHQEAEIFNGRAMTYYGRWTYKFEEAARQGAVGAIIIHQTDPAAYGWGVVEGSWSGPQLDLQRPDKGASRINMEAWVTETVGNDLLTSIGMSVDEATQAALSPDFEPISMVGMRASGQLSNVINRSDSANVVGVIKGKTNPDDYVLYMAHWDHLGMTFAPIGGGDATDTINNGAVDNATGTAALLAMAESYTNATEKPDRSVMFLAVTAEESGLLGSAYFGEDPLVPLANIVGGLNMDAISPVPPAKDLIVIGFGASELEDILKDVAARYGKYLRPDVNPEKGYFYRSDHISLAKKGVPMLYIEGSVDLVDGGETAGNAWNAKYTANRYHKPADEYDNWDMRNYTETINILRDVGTDLAYSDKAPNWYEGNEFRALRDAQLAEKK